MLRANFFRCSLLHRNVFHRASMCLLGECGSDGEGSDGGVVGVLVCICTSAFHLVFCICFCFQDFCAAEIFFLRRQASDGLAVCYWKVSMNICAGVCRRTGRHVAKKGRCGQERSPHGHLSKRIRRGANSVGDAQFRDITMYSWRR